MNDVSLRATLETELDARPHSCHPALIARPPNLPKKVGGRREVRARYQLRGEASPFLMQASCIKLNNLQ